MKVNVGKEIAAMEQMAVGQLRDRYAEVFGETTNARNKQWLLKKIIWRLQGTAVLQILQLLDVNRKKKTVQRTRRTFPREFKQQAVQMMLDGYSASSVADNLGIGNTNLLAIDKPANDSSIVFALQWRGWRWLFPGDAAVRSRKTMNRENVLQPVHFLRVAQSRQPQCDAHRRNSRCHPARSFPRRPQRAGRYFHLDRHLQRHPASPNQRPPCLPR